MPPPNPSIRVLEALGVHASQGPACSPSIHDFLWVLLRLELASLDCREGAGVLVPLKARTLLTHSQHVFAASPSETGGATVHRLSQEVQG